MPRTSRRSSRRATGGRHGCPAGGGRPRAIPAAALRRRRHVPAPRGGARSAGHRARRPALGRRELDAAARVSRAGAAEHPAPRPDHVPRARDVAIAWIDHPGSIAGEDRQHGLEHVAHHLFEVVRSLDCPVHLSHALEKPEVRLPLLLGPLVLDRDARQVGDLLDRSQLLLRRAPRFAGVDREGGQDASVGRANGGRPTRAELMAEGQIPIVDPQGILSDVGDHHRCVAIRGRSA